jgi:hypothetical protein
LFNSADFVPRRQLTDCREQEKVMYTPIKVGSVVPSAPAGVVAWIVSANPRGKDCFHGA